MIIKELQLKKMSDDIKLRRTNERMTVINNIIMKIKLLYENHCMQDFADTVDTLNYLYANSINIEDYMPATASLYPNYYTKRLSVESEFANIDNQEDFIDIEFFCYGGGMTGDEKEYFNIQLYSNGIIKYSEYNEYTCLEEKNYIEYNIASDKDNTEKKLMMIFDRMSIKILKDVSNTIDDFYDKIINYIKDINNAVDKMLDMHNSTL